MLGCQQRGGRNRADHRHHREQQFQSKAHGRGSTERFGACGMRGTINITGLLQNQIVALFPATPNLFGDVSLDYLPAHRRRGSRRDF
jgi:hypothetical protein